MNSRSLTKAIRFPTILALAGLSVLAAYGGSDNDSSSNNQGAPAVATTVAGQVQAVDRLGMRSYFGIPFAAPPVGNLRWMPPAPPQSWAAPLAKTQSNAPCLQTGATDPLRLPNGTEDCLYLDVPTPRAVDGERGRPVMVWIHGGGNFSGGTGIPIPNVAGSLADAHPPAEDAPHRE